MEITIVTKHTFSMKIVENYDWKTGYKYFFYLEKKFGKNRLKLRMFTLIQHYLFLYLNITFFERYLLQGIILMFFLFQFQAKKFLKKTIFNKNPKYDFKYVHKICIQNRFCLPFT